MVISAGSRVYVDTSVIGGYFDPEFSEHSVRLVNCFREARFRVVLSSVTQAEVEKALAAVQVLHSELLDLGAEVVRLTDEVLRLQGAYSDDGVLARRYRADMLHIALATVARVDLVVSWNFRHIVRFDKIRAFNRINSVLGYQEMVMRSPREVIPHEEK